MTNVEDATNRPLKATRIVSGLAIATRTAAYSGASQIAAKTRIPVYPALVPIVASRCGTLTANSGQEARTTLPATRTAANQ